MFNYKTWKLYYPGDDEAIAVVDENGNSITPDSLKKNMTIPAESPANDLEKVLSNINGADPQHKVENSNGLNRQLNKTAKLAIPDYSDADNGAVLTVVWEKGPDVAILDEDIGPDSPVFIYSGSSKSYNYGNGQLLDIVERSSYNLEINGDGNIFSSNAELSKEGAFVTFDVDKVTSYTFYANRLVVQNNGSDAEMAFRKAHFTLTTPSIIKKLQWSK